MTIREIRKRSATVIEVLVPDRAGTTPASSTAPDDQPQRRDCRAPALKGARARATMLAGCSPPKELGGGTIVSKSGIMLGLGG
jgi:lipoate synthase